MCPELSQEVHLSLGEPIRCPAHAAAPTLDPTVEDTALSYGELAGQAMCSSKRCAIMLHGMHKEWSVSIGYSRFKASDRSSGVKSSVAVLALNGCTAYPVCDTRPASDLAVHLIITGVSASSKVMYMVYMIPAIVAGHW